MYSEFETLGKEIPPLFFSSRGPNHLWQQMVPPELSIRETKWVWVEVAPVLKSVESGRDALNPPVSTLVGIEDELDGGLHLQLLLQGEKVLLPRTAPLGEDQHLPAGVHLRAEAWNLMWIKREGVTDW